MKKITEESRIVIEKGLITLFSSIDENPDREGLKDTPKRYMKFLEEFTSPPEFNFTTFEKEDVDEMIIMTNIPFYSLCEHHIAPFFGYGAIAYIPTKKIVGISKLARTLDKFSRRLQNQERITTQIADFIQEKLEPRGVAVSLSAQHLCMAMRGACKHDTWTTTSCMRGIFKEDQKCREEFMQYLTAPKK